MSPRGEGFIVIDLLGRERTSELDWLAAEEYLEELGIGYLADPFELRLPEGTWLRVRLTEVSESAIRVKKDDWGDINATPLEFLLPFPLPDTLRPLAADAPTPELPWDAPPAHTAR